MAFHSVFDTCLFADTLFTFNQVHLHETSDPEWEQVTDSYTFVSFSCLNYRTCFEIRKVVQLFLMIV